MLRNVPGGGLRRDYQGQSPLATLRGIPSEQIAEMYYADCHDESVPIDMRYSVFVVLKPRPVTEQQRVLRRLMPDSAAVPMDSSARPAPEPRDSSE